MGKLQYVLFKIQELFSSVYPSQDSYLCEYLSRSIAAVTISDLRHRQSSPYVVSVN